MTYEHLQVSHEADGRVVVLRFDHGKANEIGRAQLFELERLVSELQASRDVVALISHSRRASSKGTPIFVAGANVTERIGWTDEQIKQHVRWQREVLGALRAAPVFHVCVVNGIALGWGTEFLLTADYRIACAEAEFGLPETGLGILPGAGGTSELWMHVGLPQALRLGMTGERIGAGEAERIGLVQELAVDVDTALTRARALATRVARNSPTSVAAFKAGVLASAGVPFADRREIEAAAYERCVETGQAAVGRAHFADIAKGAGAPFGPRQG